MTWYQFVVDRLGQPWKVSQKGRHQEWWWIRDGHISTISVEKGCWRQHHTVIQHRGSRIEAMVDRELREGEMKILMRMVGIS